LLHSYVNNSSVRRLIRGLCLLPNVLGAGQRGGLPGVLAFNRNFHKTLYFCSKPSSGRGLAKTTAVREWLGHGTLFLPPARLGCFQIAGTRLGFKK
jgi:hypothetical protein